MKPAATRLLDAAIIWHAARVLSGARPTKADAYLHRQVAKYLRRQNGRRR